MDIIIVSTSSVQQKEYWQHRLTQMKPLLFKPSAHIICVTEDWAGGAGNGLGTLYAYQKALQKAKIEFNLDLMEAQRQGASVGLYHTAGKGKRLYPLTGSEFGNKSAVKLPGFIPGSRELISILEAVIYQTSSLSSYRKGRLSVFWGDQIFAPSSPLQVPQHHVELLCKHIPLPSYEDWVNQGYDRYGFVVNKDESATLFFEKMDAQKYASFINAHKSKSLQFGLSLGCFSLSLEILQVFLNLFKHELEQKNSSLDTDVHFWMPLLLDEQTYLHYMVEKGLAYEWVKEHFNRLQPIKHHACITPHKPLFGGWDIGKQSHWWDYGNLNAYFMSNMAILQNNTAGQYLRHFFGWDGYLNEQGSLIYNSRVASGNIINSILINVEAEHLDITDCIIINSKLNSLKANRSLLYQLKEHVPFSMNSEIRADVNIDHQYFKFYSNLSDDGKKNWSILLPKNKLSYSGLNQLFTNQTHPV